MRYYSLYLLLLVSFTFPTTRLIAQDYNVSNIPESLKENAHAVVRMDVRKLELTTDRRATMKVRYAITILNSKGDKYKQLAVFYDNSFQRAADIKGVVYDSRGKVVKKLKSKDIVDRSLYSNDITDTRVKTAALSHNSYPYTVEYSYTRNYKGLLVYPRWDPQPGSDVAVENAQLIVEDAGTTLRYKSVNGAGEPKVSKGSGYTTYSWSLKNIPVQEPEPLSPGIPYPVVYLAPDEFAIDKYYGNAESWESFSRFIYQLNQGRQELPEALKTKVKDLVKGLDSDTEKIKALYTYMQANTRYVSVQLGIGGFQTFKADHVYANGYGDCKALTNYMQAMLDEVGIKSIWALVRAGKDAKEVYPDFPSNQFNHVILCIPQVQDTLWLECTSSLAPVGYLGDFTADRYVLLIQHEGGKLIRTPQYTPEQNLQARTVNVALQNDGNAQVDVTMTCTGFQQENLRQVSQTLSGRDQEKWLRKQIDAGSFDLKSYDFETEDIVGHPITRLSYEIQANRWASPTGTRLFLKPNVLGKISYVPSAVKDRKQPVEFSYPYLDTDTVTYELPEGFVIEAQPDMPIRIESEFGEYYANFQQAPSGKLIYIRRMKMEKKQLPAQSYEELRKFFKAVSKADNVQIVLSGKS